MCRPETSALNGQLTCVQIACSYSSWSNPTKKPWKAGSGNSFRPHLVLGGCTQTHCTEKSYRWQFCDPVHYSASSKFADPRVPVSYTVIIVSVFWPKNDPEPPLRKGLVAPCFRHSYCNSQYLPFWDWSQQACELINA